MSWRVQSLRRLTRLAIPLLIASVTSLGTVASAGAQSMKPDLPDRPVPVQVSVAPTVPGKPPPGGVTLDEALAAAQAQVPVVHGFTLPVPPW